MMESVELSPFGGKARISLRLIKPIAKRCWSEGKIRTFEVVDIRNVPPRSGRFGGSNRGRGEGFLLTERLRDYSEVLPINPEGQLRFCSEQNSSNIVTISRGHRKEQEQEQRAWPKDGGWFLVAWNIKHYSILFAARPLRRCCRAFRSVAFTL
jgi:hypothetical protein